MTVRKLSFLKYLRGLRHCQSVEYFDLHLYVLQIGDYIEEFLVQERDIEMVMRAAHNGR